MKNMTLSVQKYILLMSIGQLGGETCMAEEYVSPTTGRCEYPDHNSGSYHFPQEGVLSGEELCRVGVYYNVSYRSNNWQSTRNKYNDRCKKYKEKMSFGELKKTVVFTEEDLVWVDDSSRAAYGKESPYFHSCNFLDYRRDWFSKLGYFLQKGEKWPEDPPELQWPGTDAYIDVEDFTLLVHFYPNPDNLKGNDRLVSAVYVHKARQHSSNSQQDSIFGNINWKWLINHWGD